MFVTLGLSPPSSCPTLGIRPQPPLPPPNLVNLPFLSKHTENGFTELLGGWGWGSEFGGCFCTFFAEIHLKYVLGFSAHGVFLGGVMLLDCKPTAKSLAGPNPKYRFALSERSRTILTYSSGGVVYVRIAARVRQSNLLYEFSPRNFLHISQISAEIPHRAPFTGAVETVFGISLQNFSAKFPQPLEVQFAARGGGRCVQLSLW